MYKMKEGLQKKKVPQFHETVTGMLMLGKRWNQGFQESHYTEWCPDQLVSKFHISIIKAPFFANTIYDI